MPANLRWACQSRSTQVAAVTDHEQAIIDTHAQQDPHLQTTVFLFGTYLCHTAGTHIRQPLVVAQHCRHQCLTLPAVSAWQGTSWQGSGQPVIHSGAGEPLALCCCCRQRGWPWLLWQYVIHTRTRRYQQNTVCITLNLYRVLGSTRAGCHHDPGGTLRTWLSDVKW